MPCATAALLTALRGFARDPVRDLNLQTSGMEFASELVVKAAIAGYRIANNKPVFTAALRGPRVGWGKLERSGRVDTGQPNIATNS